MLHHLRLLVLTRCIGVLLMAQVIAAADIVLPASGSLKVPVGQKMVIRTLGSGNQIYKCDPASLKWTSAGATAELFDVTKTPNPEGLPEALMTRGDRTVLPRLNLKDFSQIGNHFFSKDVKPVPIFRIKNREIRTAEIGSEKSPGSPDRIIKLKVTQGTLAKTVFQTSTSGGQLDVQFAGACTKADFGNTIQQPYAALYTFFA
ncbi:hypothetical protein MJO28_009743 [Puccinia striiformis f. sp. tritici]|uniref:Uncharacterized protein n=1 Tax=Puccinia striiformis f. sp. tritici TaxID=168172 RepID=A0ACC0E7X0_9BASI|nr:hypothetical protein Pst134EB_018314 [Puccinia striiformis f. sp. tritici]KAI7947835.1 hypothetical protein MJO28_009743 [Puccinia striiformis f. sp. tritici]